MAPMARQEDEVLGMLNADVRENASAVDFVMNAWRFAEKVHGGQKRRSGEPHTEHLFQTARKLSELGMNEVIIAAGLLHDAIEDTEATETDIETAFGAEVALLVAGVTKLERTSRANRAYQAENLRILFTAAAKDARVLLIKLADRLHNMYTLEHLPPNKRASIAKETEEIYVPVADRLGMNVMKRELEDLAFQHLDPKEHARTSHLLSKRLAEREEELVRASADLLLHLSFVAPFPVRVERRIKGQRSFARKLERKQGDLEAINDVVTLQVIVPDTDDCYRALGYIHGLWRPIPGKMKDYIAFPKPNGYQCLRTAVDAGPMGIIEIQIYSEAMYARAQYGFALEFSAAKHGPKGGLLSFLKRD